MELKTLMRIWKAVFHHEIVAESPYIKFETPSLL